MTTQYQKLINGHSRRYFKKLILIFALSANLLIPPYVTYAMERENDEQTKRRKLNPKETPEEDKSGNNPSRLFGKGLSNEIRCIWISEEPPTFQIKKATYPLNDTHRKLYEKVSPAQKFFKQFLIAQFHLLGKYVNKENKTAYMCFTHDFKNEDDQELLFIPGSTARPNQNINFFQVDFNSLQSLLNIQEKDIFKWFVEIYWNFESARKNLGSSFYKGNNQSHAQQVHHTEQWLGLYLWYKTFPLIKEILKRNSEIKEVSGIVIPFFSLFDVCTDCQEMWHHLMQKLPEKIKKHWKENTEIPLANDFFILPIAASSQYYGGGGRLSPIDPAMRDELSKLNKKLNVKGPQFLSREQLNFLQYTSEYKRLLKERTKSISEEYRDVHFLHRKGVFPCVWLPEEAKVASTLAEKFNTVKKEQLNMLFTTKKGIPVLNSHWTEDEIITYVSAPHLYAKASNLNQLRKLNLSLGGLDLEKENTFLKNVFSSLPHLVSLKIKDFDEVAPLVENMRVFPTLETLRIKNNDDITHSEIKGIATVLPNLKELSLFSWITADEQGLMNDEDEWFRDSSVSLLAKSLTKLESLSFQAYMITDRAIHTIAKYLTNLRSLDASVFYCTNKSLKYLAKLPLQNLSLYQMETAEDNSQGDINDKSAKYVASMTTLRSLRLDRFQISDKALQTFFSLPSLTTLDVGRNNISNGGAIAAINFLKEKSTFSSLEIFGNRISSHLRNELLKFKPCAQSQLRFDETDSDEE